MNLNTARIASFLLSVAGLVVAMIYMFSSNKVAMKPLMYAGLVFVLGSLVLRNMTRFKPEWFGDKPNGMDDEDEKK